MNAFEKSSDLSGEISLVDGRGIALGRFDINAVEGIEKLSEKNMRTVR